MITLQNDGVPGNAREDSHETADIFGQSENITDGFPIALGAHKPVPSFCQFTDIT